MSQAELKKQQQEMDKIAEDMWAHLKNLSKKELMRTVMGQVNLILELRHRANQLNSELEQLKPQPELQKETT